MGFNPNEPRVQTGPHAGEWTAGDAGSAIQNAASDKKTINTVDELKPGDILFDRHFGEGKVIENTDEKLTVTYKNKFNNMQNRAYSHIWTKTYDKSSEFYVNVKQPDGSLKEIRHTVDNFDIVNRLHKYLLSKGLDAKIVDSSKSESQYIKANGSTIRIASHDNGRSSTDVSLTHYMSFEKAKGALDKFFKL